MLGLNVNGGLRDVLGGSSAESPRGTGPRIPSSRGTITSFAAVNRRCDGIGRKGIDGEEANFSLIEARIDT